MRKPDDIDIGDMINDTFNEITWQQIQVEQMQERMRIKANRHHIAFAIVWILLCAFSTFMGFTFSKPQYRWINFLAGAVWIGMATYHILAIKRRSK